MPVLRRSTSAVAIKLILRAKRRWSDHLGGVSKEMERDGKKGGRRGGCRSWKMKKEEEDDSSKSPDVVRRFFFALRPRERTFSQWPFSLKPRIWCRPSAAGDTVIYRHPPVPFVTFLPSTFSPTISLFAENEAAKYISAVEQRLLLKELGHSDQLHLVVREAIT